MLWLSLQTNHCSLASMMAPCIKIDIAMLAASTDGEHISWNSQPKNRFNNSWWMYHFYNKAWKLVAELGVKILCDVKFPLTVMFIKMSQGFLW